MSKEGGEALCLEHEAGVVGVGCDAAEGVFGAGEVEVFFGADGEFDVFVHVVVVGVVVAVSVGVVGHGPFWVCDGDDYPGERGGVEM